MIQAQTTDFRLFSGCQTMFERIQTGFESIPAVLETHRAES
jgi:hypothetical protein